MTYALPDRDLGNHHPFAMCLTCLRTEVPSFRRWDAWCDVARYLASLPSDSLGTTRQDQRIGYGDPWTLAFRPARTSSASKR
ncbi:hypothetical protein BH09GEM1_BH09GEM1_07520 [soil metagenome]